MSAPSARTCRTAAVVLLAVACLAGCVSQDYCRATGQSAAAGAMQGVRDGTPRRLPRIRR